ncbi:MAG: hypothetical protein ABT940_12740 [Alphaproteobacteria bacterium]
MANRKHRELLLVENEMAQLAAGQQGMDHLWQDLQNACRQPVWSLDDIDRIAEDLRDVQAGLDAGRRALQQLRSTIK